MNVPMSGSSTCTNISQQTADLLEHGSGHGAGPGEGGGGARQAAELLALLLLVDEVAARPVGAVALDPVLLAVLRLILVVPNNILLHKQRILLNLRTVKTI